MSHLISEQGRALQSVLQSPRCLPLATHDMAGVDLVYDGKKNLGFTEDAPTVPAEMTAFVKRMGQAIYRVAGQVYVAVGYGLANVIFVVNDGASSDAPSPDSSQDLSGIVVIDTCESVPAAQSCLQDFYKACPTAKLLPIRAVIYTHNHSDHVNGVRAFATDEAVASGACAIIAHESLMEAVRNNASVVGPILSVRSLYSFGALLPTGATGVVHNGIGPQLVRGPASFFAPTLTFAQSLDIQLCGIRFELRHAPSETDDEIVAWLPDLGVLLSAEVIQGECLANVHTLRGTRYRDPLQWVRTIDAMRATLHSKTSTQPVGFMVPAHGRPVAGEAQIDQLLTAYRDAIAFIHDQAARFMNQGCTPNELAEVLPALPPHLAQHAWLGEYYGTVKHSVRQVFTGQLGWFDGDPTTLNPLPGTAHARRMVAQMGGREAVLQAIQTSQTQGDHQQEWQWQAELATWLLREGVEDAVTPAAKACKARALRAMGLASVNSNWRNWYLSAAAELQGAYDDFQLPASAGLISSDILQSLPPAQLLGLLSVRLLAESCFDEHRCVQFCWLDGGQAGALPDVTLELRKGVLQVWEGAPSELASGTHAQAPPAPNPRYATCPALGMASRDLPELLTSGAAVFQPWMANGKLRLLRGSLVELAQFFAFFDPRSPRLPKLASR